MTRTRIAVGALAAVLVLLALLAGYRVLQPGADPTVAASQEPSPSTGAEELTDPEKHTHPQQENLQGFLYGRITTVDGSTYEGRLRWGGDEEAFWGDYFNGFKDENPWIIHVPSDQRKERRSMEILGVEIFNRERQIDPGRPFMARMGDITRIDAHGSDVRVTLKSGTVFSLDRFSAGDFDDGIRVWDDSRGVVNLDSLRIRKIEFLPSPSPGSASYRLHGTVRTRQGDFTGFVQWDREDCLGSDELDGHTADGAFSLRFDTIGSIARRSDDGSLVTLLDGREIALSGNPGAGRGNRGIYVDDRRYGRVLISRDTFQRVDFSPGGSGPAYGDFPPGHPLTGSVTTRAGVRHAGRLVYDLDESETTETLDAPSGGVDYTIPFGMIASIVLPGGEHDEAGDPVLILRAGEELRLERSGDLADENTGILIFADGLLEPGYVSWTDVARIDFDRPPPGAKHPGT